MDRYSCEPISPPALAKDFAVPNARPGERKLASPREFMHPTAQSWLLLPVVERRPPGGTVTPPDPAAALVRNLFVGMMRDSQANMQAILS